MAGPYLAARLRPGLVFDARFAYGRSSNDLSIAGIATPGLETRRWLLRGRLTGELRLARWIIKPHAGALYFGESHDAVVDSAGLTTPKQSVSLGRLTFGPEIETTLALSGGATLRPFVAVSGIWDFKRAESARLVNAALVRSSDVLHLEVSAGTTVLLRNGWRLRALAQYDGIGADLFDAYGGSVALVIPVE